MTTPDAGGPTGGTGGSAIGGAGGGSDVADGGDGPGGTGVIDGGPVICPVDPSVVACGLLDVAGVGLASDGGAIVAYGFTGIKRWDPSVQTWKTISADGAPAAETFPRQFVMRVDSLARVVGVRLTVDDSASARLSVVRQDGDSWTSLTSGLPADGEGSFGYDLAIDSLDRPLLLLDSLTPPAAGTTGLRLFRWEGSTWVNLSGAAPINNVPITGARLTVDSGDGVTPYVAAQEQDNPATVYLARFDGSSWSALPPFSAGLAGTFDLAVAGGQTYISYLDGPSSSDARPFVSQSTASGWSTGLRLDADVDLPVVSARILATGPAASDVLVAWETREAASGPDHVFVKQAPDWSRLAVDPPVAGEDMDGFAIAVDPTRIGLAWTNRDPASPYIRYFEIPR